MATYSICTFPPTQWTPDHEQGTISLGFQFAREPKGSESTLARNSNKTNAAFRAPTLHSITKTRIQQVHFNNIRVNKNQGCIKQELPSSLSDQEYWFSRLRVKARKNKIRNPVEFHLPPIAWWTKVGSGDSNKSPGFLYKTNPFN